MEQGLCQAKKEFCFYQAKRDMDYTMVSQDMTFAKDPRLHQTKSIMDDVKFKVF